MTPTVSVMMAAYDTEDYVRSAVKSMLSQTFTDFELLIIDDGSTDGTGEILRELAAKDHRIKLLRRPNAGIVRTRNELLQLASGEFVAILDSDDVALPERLELAVRYLRQHADVLAVGGQVEVIDPDGAPLCVWRLNQSHAEIDAQLLSGANVAICHSAATIRRLPLLEIGGYRDLSEFHGQAEDFDMWLRLSERGPIQNLPVLVAQYRVRLTSASVAGLGRQIAAAQIALTEAIGRRKIADQVPSLTTLSMSKAETFALWGWWALGSGHVATARKHAKRAIVAAPLALRGWKLLLCAMRGY